MTETWKPIPMFCPNCGKMNYGYKGIDEILGVGRQAVYKLIKKGCFKAVLVDNKFRIIKASFDAWLENE